MSAAWDRFEQGNRNLTPPLETYGQLTLAINGLRRDAEGWIAERGPAEAARRRLAVATYALNMLQNVDASSLWQESQAASTLLELACATLRKSPPTEGERAWHQAALAMLEASAPAASIRRHLQHAEARFPDEGRWAIVRLVAEESSVQGNVQADGRITIPAGQAAKLAAAYQSASEHQGVRAEAQVRWGRHELELGRLDEALRHFDLAGDPEDSVVRYWLHLFRGQALERLGRRADAIAAYRLAVRDAPSAQSAGLALAAALATDHQTAAAAAQVSQSLADGAAPPDPWLYYRTPDTRFLDALMSGLMGAIVR